MKKLLSVLLTLVMLVPAFGSFPVIASAGSAVAQVIDSNGNATDYPTFEAAWKEAVNYRKTFKLLSDWMVSGGDFGANESNKATFFNGGALSVPPDFSVTIDLNGYKISRDKGVNNMTDDGSIIRLFDGASITINDTSENQKGAIERGSSNYGGGIYAPSNNTVTMNGGRIHLCNGYYGGGVYLDSTSKFIMNGGRIEHNTGYYGGGVYAEDDAVLETHGGAISENRATADGGGIYLWSAQANLDNCSVSDNRAKNGGAIYSDYNVFKDYSYIVINNSKILNNTADNYYGGIYHCAAGFSVLGNTRIAGNKNERYYGGGVYLQKTCMYLSGNVQVYGNYSNGHPCDVNFGKSLNEAFILKGHMEQDAMIGVYKTNGTTPVYWCRSYHPCVNCTDTDNNMKSLAECLFLNESGANGFSYSETKDSHYQDITWHDTRVDRGNSTVKYDVKVTQVRYKGVILSPSEYSSDYNAGSRIITLNVPDYVTDTNRLTVYANKKNSDNQWDPGKEISFSDGFDISDKQALIINTVNKSPDYTVTVHGGTVDGKESATKKYLEPFSIAPIVPAGKVFSHWEIEGDNADDITGFEKYAKSPAKLEMPQHDVKFKAVFAEEVSRVDITLPQPKGGDKLELYPTATVYYKTADGSVKGTETVNVKWRKRNADEDIKKFDYNTSYHAWLSFSDSRPDYDFGFADAEKFKLYVNDEELTGRYSDKFYTYSSRLETGGSVAGTAPDSFAVRQRIMYVNYTNKTAKAEVLEVEKPSIEIPTDTSAEALKNLLPDSVNITYESIDGNKTASAPVLWNTASLTGTVQDNAEINGTVTIPETLEAAEDKKQTTITVKVTSDKQRLQKPTASVADGAIIALDEKIMLSAEDGATIWYKIDDGAFTQYNADTGIVPQGEAGKTVERKITAYCTEEGYLQSQFLTLNIKVDNGSFYTVKIVDKNGAIYGYASGAGEYKIGDSVTVKATENDPEKFVSSWSAEGITLSESDKTASEFTFTMPAKDVTITAESFRYYVSKLYLSSITPIADNPLPQTLEIIGAEDINGNVIDKKDVLANVKIQQWQTVDENEKSTTISNIENYKTIKDNKYRAIVSVERKNSAVKAVCDNYEIFFGDEKLVSQGEFIPLYYIDFTAVYDELKSVNLGDSITAYTGNYIDFPEKIGVKTKYGSITTANVTWTGTEKVDTSKVGTYNVTATLTLPDNVTATDAQKNINVTVKVRSLINSVALETVDGNVPAKSGESLPTSLKVKSDGARFVENSFSVSTNNGTPVSGDAVSGTKYTITAKVAPAENCEFAANTIFTINGIAMNATPVENGEYELTYTFTAEEVQSYDVIVKGGESQKCKEGDTVNISTSASDFYKWTAEVVYETTETIIGENDNTETKTVTHRNPISIFADGGEYKAETSFVMPKLADGRRLELTANKAHGIIAYDKQTMTADIVADKAYNGKTVIFAAYSDGKLVSVEYVNKNLTKGFNAVTAPKAFSITGADTIKVMVWTDFENIIPLFEDFEKQITGDEIK